jgi:argininosuccinate lyase
MGRFSDSHDDLFRRINHSVSFDQRLYPQDIRQSIAHARMLASCGIIEQPDFEAIERGLGQVGTELDEGEFEFLPDDEDIHMAIERRLTELVGDPGAKLHTSRSRNDQVATDVCLFVRERARVAAEKVTAVMTELLNLARSHEDWPMPGYTHLQRAQSVVLAHHLLAYFWMLDRDRSRFAAAERATSVLPLGSGALAGANWETDRAMVAQELGFEFVGPNSMDGVANRDFVLDYLFAAATCATHLSRLGAEIVLWSSEEFGFCEVADGFASGSSLMPQKKNPDAAELLRAKAPRVLGNLVTLQGVMHGLPLTYNKDMQEDKEALFEAVDTIELCLDVAAGMLPGIKFDRDRMATAAGDQMLAAVDIADLLVRKGMPFRQAHDAVGTLVAMAIEHGKQLSDLSDDQLSAVSPLLDQDFRALIADGGWIESKLSEGSTGPSAVQKQLARAEETL